MVSYITLLVLIVIALCVGAVVGLLVGRKNPKIANQANTDAQRALDAVNKAK